MEAEEKKERRRRKGGRGRREAKARSIEENQVEVVVEEKTADTQQETVMPLEKWADHTDEPKTAGEGERGSDEILQNEKMEEEAKERAEAAGQVGSRRKRKN